MSLVTVQAGSTSAVSVVTMDDAARYNALTSAMVSDLKDAFADARNDRAARAVVLTGAGRGFCSGANMGGGDELPERARDRGPVGLVQMSQEHIAGLILAVRELPQPVIAAVHGAAIGGGLALALACDLRVASDDARFAAHFIKVGLSSCDVGTSYLLPRIVGPTIAAELMLTGRRFTAEEGARLGFLNRVVPRDALLATAVELGELIAANSEYGVSMTKIGLWANLDAPSLRYAMELENRTQVLGTFTGNMTEAGRAFVEKRDPVWRKM
jgi:enoyl-CoA hydratase/carnithine racemase